MSSTAKDTGPIYLARDIVDSKETPTVPRYGIGRDGYTHRSGAPTRTMICLKGEYRWRRVMIWQFSNAGTCFVKIGGVPHIIPSHLAP